MRLTLNWRFLLTLTVAVLILGFVVHRVHGWQIRKQSGVLLLHADQARTANDTKHEKVYLQRYLLARPDDIDARERYVRLLQSTAKTRPQLVEAFLTIEDVLRRDPKRDALRQVAVDTALDSRVGLYSEAQSHLDVLLKNRPQDGELEALLAVCLTRLQKYEQARDWYNKSIEHRPDLVNSYAGCAAILRLHLNRPAEADRIIVRLLQTNPANFRSHLIVAQYWQAFFKLEQTAGVAAEPVAKAQKLADKELVSGAVTQSVAEARRLAPDERDVILMSAAIARVRSRDLAVQGNRDESEKATVEARQMLTRGIALHPKSAGIYLALADLEADTRTMADAIAVVRKGLQPDAVPDSPELTLALLDYQIRAGDKPGATATLDLLRTGGLPPTIADYHHSRLLILDEQWLEASWKLERVRQDLQNEPRLARETNVLLGHCYAQLGEYERRLEAYTRAADDPTDPAWIPATIGIAETQAALGQADAALTTYRKLKDYAPGAWLQIARLEMIRALRSPPGADVWKPAETAIAAAEQAFKNLPEERIPTDLWILRADLLYFQKRPAEARKQLELLRDKRPKEIAAWVGVAQQDLRDGNAKQAAATLDAAEKAIGDSPDLRIARARLWAETKDAALSTKIVTLANRLDSFTPAQKRRLLRDLAGIAAAAGATDAAGRLWDQIAVVNPHDLAVQLNRFDRALRANDGAAMSKAVAAIQKIDGENGPSVRLSKAVLRIWEAQTQKKDQEKVAALDEALQLLEKIAQERPGWNRVALAQAMAYDEKGNTDAALAKYKLAVELGELNPVVLRRLTELLYKKQRLAEAEEVLRKLPNIATADAEVQRLAAGVSLQIGDKQRAVELAAKAISENSKEPRDYLWLGQVYFAAGETVKAEAPFRKAVDLRPDSQDAWLILIRYLAATNRKPEAERTLERARDRVNQADRPLFLALAYAQFASFEKTAEAFRLARAAKPDDLPTLQAEAEFLFRNGQLDKAREVFQSVIGLKTASPDDKRFARYMLAICLASDENYETSRKALEVLGLLDDTPVAPGVPLTPIQRRARAQVLALQKDRASKLEAIRLLEELGNALTPGDLYLLARVHHAVGNRPHVRIVMATLLQRKEAKQVPLYVTFFAAWLLREGDIRDADVWIRQLEEIDPANLTTAELRARWHAARKDSAAARKVLLPRFEVDVAALARVSRICEDVGLQEDAERLLKRFVAENKTAQPQVVLALAAYYGRQKRLADALRVCEENRKTLPSPVVGDAAVAALYAASSPSAAEMAKVAAWFEEAIAANQGETRATMVQLLASIRNLQGDYNASTTLYRQALETNPNDFLAMNNLAFLLSAREGKHDEALRLLAQARRILGPNTDLVDTEAIVRLNRGEVDAARKLIEGVISEAPSSVGYFHLALIEMAAKRDLEARVAWKKSGELGLRSADLHPLERPAYELFVGKFK